MKKALPVIAAIVSSLMIMGAPAPVAAQEWVECEFDAANVRYSSVKMRLYLDGQSCVISDRLPPRRVADLALSLNGNTGLVRAHHLYYGRKLILTGGGGPQRGDQLRPSVLEVVHQPEIVETSRVGSDEISTSRIALEVFHVPYVVEATTVLRDGQLATGTRARMRRGEVDLASVIPEDEVHGEILDALAASSGVCDVNHPDFFSECEIVANVLTNRSISRCLRNTEIIRQQMAERGAPETAEEIGLELIWMAIKLREANPLETALRSCGDPLEITAVN